MFPSSKLICLCLILEQNSGFFGVLLVPNPNQIIIKMGKGSLLGDSGVSIPSSTKQKISSWDFYHVIIELKMKESKKKKKKKKERKTLFSIPFLLLHIGLAFEVTPKSQTSFAIFVHYSFMRHILFACAKRV